MAALTDVQLSIFVCAVLTGPPLAFRMCVTSFGKKRLAPLRNNFNNWKNLHSQSEDSDFFTTTSASCNDAILPIGERDDPIALELEMHLKSFLISFHFTKQGVCVKMCVKKPGCGHTCLTVSPNVSRGTPTDETINLVLTDASILAGIGSTLVDICSGHRGGSEAPN